MIKTSLSVQVFWNVTNDVTHRIFLQHLFSSSSIQVNQKIQKRHLLLYALLLHQPRSNDAQKHFYRPLTQLQFLAYYCTLPSSFDTCSHQRILTPHTKLKRNEFHFMKPNTTSIKATNNFTLNITWVLVWIGAGNTGTHWLLLQSCELPIRTH